MHKINQASFFSWNSLISSGRIARSGSRILLVLLVVIALFLFLGCAKPVVNDIAAAGSQTAKVKQDDKKGGIEEYSKVITKDAKSDEGIFTVHFVGEKLYYEIHNNMLDKEMIIVSRIARAANNLGYGGQKTNTQTVRWQKYNDKILLRIITYENVAKEDLPVYQAVKNANFEPVIYTFDIKAYNKDKSSSVIEVTDLFKKDIPFLGLNKNAREAYKIKKLDTDRTLIIFAKSFPKNIEVRVLLTYEATQPPANPSTGTISLEMNHSMVMLPENPMIPRMWDERVGFFSIEQVDYGLDAQKSEKRKYITRWRLEPADREAFTRGELVEPVKPLVYYIDPATPEKWRSYIKQAVEDWIPAFEAAGFKNAIMCKYPPSPEEDPEFCPEDARYSVIRWFPSEIQNAYGPHVHDPRTGEILESDIGLFHNVMNLARDWFFIQTAAANPEARSVKFKDEVMGRLIRYIVAHEVGHTLGLPHNMKSSSTYTVEQLRDPEFTEKYGTTPSIMDYARFNYVAQPGDGVKNFVPVIGPYDIYSIKWGYRPIPEAKKTEDEKPVLDKWIIENYDDPVYQFNDLSTIDPTSQREAVGDDAMKASTLGITNLKIIMNNLIKWSYQERADYSQLEELYKAAIGQWNLYMNHVATYIGGVTRTRKTYDQEGPVYEIVPEKKQQEALNFLYQYALKTPDWMVNKDILDRIESSGIVDRVRAVQVNVINNILNPARIERLIEAEARLGDRAYTLNEFFRDLHNAVWKELTDGTAIDIYRRNMQRGYIERLEYLMTKEPEPIPPLLRQYIDTTDVKVSQSDIRPYARGELEKIKRETRRALNSVKDNATILHLKDIIVRIDDILKSKKE